MTRAADAELLSLRARLAKITSTLSSFAATRAATPNQLPISAEVRATFEDASKASELRDQRDEAINSLAELTGARRRKSGRFAEHHPGRRPSADGRRQGDQSENYNHGAGWS